MITAKSVREQPWDKNLQMLLALIVAFNIIPHMLTVPVWVSITALGCIGWKVAYLVKGVPLPKRWFLGLTALAVGVGAFFEYGTILGRDAASALLVILASLKLLETNKYRDAMLVVFSGYFLLMAYLLDSQSLNSTVYMGLDVLLITTLMFHLHKRDRRTSVRSFRPVMRLLGFALPVWVVLFIGFPRFSTALWNMKQQQSQTGFSDELNPGSVGKLASSDEIAFRVTFAKNQTPYGRHLYWRGAVLSIGNGLKWSRIPNEVPVKQSELPEPSPQAVPISYEAWLEPGFDKWLFVLESPLVFDSSNRLARLSVRRLPGGVFESGRAIPTTVVFNATATLAAPYEKLSATDRAISLQVPEDLDPRLTALAKSVVAEVGKEPQKVSGKFLDWLMEQNFRYTREPGALKASDTVAQLGEFLFESKKGFCEHFAAAYATFMRLTGTPARVVVGFQGGQMNDLGDYFLVRHMDAHAWTEIWVPEGSSERGRWMRVDPTETVAPLRIELGGDFNRLDSDLLARGLSSDALQRQLNGGLIAFSRRFGLAWDLLQMRWNGFLLQYDFDYQMQLLKKMGVSTASSFVLMAGLITSLVLFALACMWVMRREAKKEDPVITEWRRFCRSIEKAGLVKKPGEGALSFARRVAEKNPKAGEEVLRIADLYNRIRYAKIEPSEARALAKSFRQSARRFSIEASSRDATS